MVVAFMATTSVSAGQSQTQNPQDPTVAALALQQQQLTAQQAIMDARLKIQQDQQNMLTGALPASTATPNSGAFTVTGNTPFPSQKLAYESLEGLAKDVADKLVPANKGTDLIGPGPVVIYDQTEINSLINYKAVTKVLTTLQTQITNLQRDFTNNLDQEAKRLLHSDITAAPAAAMAAKSFAGILTPGLVLGGLKTATDIIGMFRTNTNIAFSSFTADDVALTAAVVDQLRVKGKAVSEPAVMPLAVTDDSSPFIDLLSLVQTTLLNLQDNAGVDQVQVQQLSDALNAFMQADQALKANGDPAKTPDLTATRDGAQQFAAGLLGTAPGSAMDLGKAAILKAQCDQFVKSIAGLVTAVTAASTALGTLQTSLAAVSNTGSATLTSILRAEKLMDTLKTAGARILAVKTSVLAGSVVTKTNLFKGGTLIYTGGAIATFTLFDAAGAVLAAGVAVGDSSEKPQKF
jgi:hypothetical protein